MQDFEDLEAWKLARSLRNEIFILTKTFPPEEKYRLTDQLVRASRSISANVAEGYGRYHYKDNAKFCRIARETSFPRRRESRRFHPGLLLEVPRCPPARARRKTLPQE